MGNKINPNGLRVGIIRDWEAKWYAGKDYAAYLREDLQIRKYISKRLASASVSTVEIERAANRVNISIHTAKPGMVIGKGGSEVENLRKELNDLTGKRFISILLKLRSLILMQSLLARILLVNWKAELLSVGQCVNQCNGQCVLVLRELKPKSLAG